MSMLNILLHPDPRLKRICEPVARITPEVETLAADMLATMYDAPGVGLAAPQIGIMLRLAVVDASDKRGQAIRMANPEVLHASTQMRAHDEASPNLPGVFARIERPRAVTVRFLNDRAEIEDRDFVGLWATSVQHQIDHLDGKLYVDHLTPLRRKMLVAKSAKLARR